MMYQIVYLPKFDLIFLGLFDAKVFLKRHRELFVKPEDTRYIAFDDSI